MLGMLFLALEKIHCHSHPFSEFRKSCPPVARVLREANLCSRSNTENKDPSNANETKDIFPEKQIFWGEVFVWMGLWVFFNRICYRVVLDRLRIVCKNPNFGLSS